MSREFAKDGLGEDFGDFLLDLDNLSKRIQDSEASDEGNSSMDGSESEMDEETRREMELLAQEDATFMQGAVEKSKLCDLVIGFDDLPTDDEEEEDDLAQFETEDEEEDDDSEVQKNTLMNQNRGQVDSGLTRTSVVSEAMLLDESEAENSEAENDNTENKSEDQENDEDSNQNENPTTDQANTTETVEEDIYGRPKIPSTGKAKNI
ncbi:unnamed protein product [Aphanomyces euteiches]